MSNKKLIILFLFSIAACYFHKLNAQVGIGTEDPTNTLHLKPMEPEEDPLKVEDLNQIMQGDSAFLVVDPSTGLVRYMPIGDLLNYVNFTIDQSNTNELQNASEVPLNPGFDLDNNGTVETNVQSALETIGAKLPKGTYKSIAEAKAAGLVVGDSFYTDPEGVFGCSGCIITLFEGM
ncbi:MAG: hypothetical protein AAF573_03930 [Bacteroidota bacterium]